MDIVQPFWARQGQKVAYPDLRQQQATCVFVSVASAVNWLTGNALTEAGMLSTLRSLGKSDASFGNALACVPTLTGLETAEYHDADNPLADPKDLVDRVKRGGVLIFSVELAQPVEEGVLERCGEWHMIAVFHGVGDDAQVWDTNGFAGFLNWDEVLGFLAGESIGVPYVEGKVLVPHDKHHCLYIRKAADWNRVASRCQNEIALANSSRSQWATKVRPGANEGKVNSEHDEFLARALVFEQIQGICERTDPSVIASRIKAVADSPDMTASDVRDREAFGKNWRVAYEYALDQCELRGHI